MADTGSKSASGQRVSAASKRHMSRVAELPCVVCGIEGVQVHHIRAAGLTGAGQRCSDWFTIPLCQEDHADLHRGIKTWETRNGSQASHVAKTLDVLYGGKT